MNAKWHRSKEYQAISPNAKIETASGAHIASAEDLVSTISAVNAIFRI